MMRHSANAAAWTAPGEVWEYVSQLVSSYHDQHDCQVLYHSCIHIMCQYTIRQYNNYILDAEIFSEKHKRVFVLFIAVYIVLSIHLYK